jgi:hypothetical protein
MGRGRRSQHRVSARPAPVRPSYRRRDGVEPDWGDFARARYDVTYSDELISAEVGERFNIAVSPRQVGDYLRQHPRVVRRRRLDTLPFSHGDVSSELTNDRHERLFSEAAKRLDEGESDGAVDDWIEDELARYGHAEHICYSDEELFNSEEMVTAIIRRLKKWHRAVGRPVAGEGFEDLLAGAWSDSGVEVVLAPRNYDGADAHVALVPNQWVAMSMKSEGARQASARTIHLSSIAPHRVELASAAACRDAIGEAVTHLRRYDRMIYLRSEESIFPSDGLPAHRYTLLELPKRDIFQRLLHLPRNAFAHLFVDHEEAAERNTFTVPICDERGRKLFNVTVSRRPPRVSVTAIEFDYCRLISSYWTEPVAAVERISRAVAESGSHTSSRVARYSRVVDGMRHFGLEDRLAPRSAPRSSTP